MRLKYSIQTNRLSSLTINVEMPISMRRGILDAKIEHFIHKIGLFGGGGGGELVIWSPSIK